MYEILETSYIFKNRLFIPKSVRTIFDLHDGEKLVWLRNKNGDLVLKKNTVRIEEVDTKDIMDY